MIRCVNFFTLLAILVLPISARAGVWVEGAATAYQANDDRTGSSVSDVRVTSNSTLGYHFGVQGLLLGGQFLTDRSSAIGDYAWGIGPKAGLLIKGFELSAAYLVYANDTLGIASRAGAGYAVNLGYTFHLFGPVRLGLQGTYWSMTFTQQNGVTLSPTQHKDMLTPEAALAFDF